MPHEDIDPTQSVEAEAPPEVPADAPPQEPESPAPMDATTDL